MVCKFGGTKEIIYITKALKSHRICSGHHIYIDTYGTGKVRWLQRDIHFSLSFFFTCDLAATFLRLRCDFSATFLRLSCDLLLSCDFLATLLRLSRYFIATFLLVSCDFLATFLRLSGYFLATFLLLSCDFHATFLRLSCYFLATFLLLYCDFLATLLRLSCYFIATFLLLSCDLAAWLPSWATWDGRPRCIAEKQHGFHSRKFTGGRPGILTLFPVFRTN